MGRVDSIIYMSISLIFCLLLHLTYSRPSVNIYNCLFSHSVLSQDDPGNSPNAEVCKKKVLEEFRKLEKPWGLLLAGKVPGESQDLIWVDGFAHTPIHLLTCQSSTEH